MTNAKIVGNRIELEWVAGARGKPGLNADIDSTTDSVREIADEDFELQGTVATASSDDVTIAAEGGILLTTDGADNDALHIVPHQDTSQSGWAQITWGTDREVSWEALIKTGTDITNVHYVLGLKSDLDMTLDDADLVVFNFNTDDTDTTWGLVANEAAGTAVDVDTGVRVVINQIYKLRLTAGADQVVRAYIDDELVGSQSFAGGAEDLVPFIGVQSLSGAEDVFTIFGQKIGRILA